jgi:hypothetical protein
MLDNRITCLQYPEKGCCSTLSLLAGGFVGEKAKDKKKKKKKMIQIKPGGKGTVKIDKK